MSLKKEHCLLTTALVPSANNYQKESKVKKIFRLSFMHLHLLDILGKSAMRNN